MWDILEALLVVIISIIATWWITDGYRKWKARKIIKGYNITHDDEITYIIAQRILKNQL